MAPRLHELLGDALHLRLAQPLVVLQHLKQLACRMQALC